MIPCCCITVVIVLTILIKITPRRLCGHLIGVIHHIVQRERLSVVLKIEKFPCFSDRIGATDIRCKLFWFLADTRMIEVEFTIVVGLAVQDVVKILCHVHAGNMTINLCRVIFLVQGNIVQVEICVVAIFFACVKDLVLIVILLINIIDILRHLRGVLAVVIVQRAVTIFIEDRAILQHPEPRLHVGCNGGKILVVFGRTRLQFGILCAAEGSRPAVIFGQIVKVLSIRAETHHIFIFIIVFRLGCTNIRQLSLFQMGQQLIALVLQHHDSILARAAFSSKQKKSACKQNHKNDCNHRNQFAIGFSASRSPHVWTDSLRLHRARRHRRSRGSLDNILRYRLRSCQPRTAATAEFCAIRKCYSTFRANHTQFLHIFCKTVSCCDERSVTT